MRKQSRRQFLIRTGWAGGGVTMLSACGFVPPLPTFGVTDAKDIYTWVQLRPDGRVRFYLPRAEMGQGIDISLAKVVAEELNLPIDRIDCVPQDTDAMAPCQMTVGSQSIENYFELTALTAANLRTHLGSTLAAKHGVATGDVDSVAGGFKLPSGLVIKLEDVIAEEEVIQRDPVSESISLFSKRPAAERRLVGGASENPTLLDIVTGKTTYSRDVRLPDMCYGVVARPPQLGARLVSFDAAAAAAVDGVVGVAQGPQGEVGIVARTPHAATAGLSALAARWQALTESELAAAQHDLDIDAYIEADALDHTTHDEGDIRRGEQMATARIDTRYDTPMAAHAAMEPRAGVAHFKSKGTAGPGCEIWTGSQDPWLVRAAAARALGIDDKRVRVHNCRIGGAFGGRLLCQASIEAAWLSQGTGVPVKVQWSREDEFRHNYVGPQFSTRIQAGIDGRGNITHWHHRMVGAPILTSSMFIPPRLRWAADLVADPGTQRGTELPYAIANKRVSFADKRVPMATGAWRGLGAAPNTFAVEVAMDELAARAGVHPLSLRKRHATDPRLQAVCEGLQTKVPEAQHVGFAATAYKGVTFVAVAAGVETRNGKPRVSDLWCVHDCGFMVDPDRVRAQIEGNLIWGVGMALQEEFVLENGLAATDNFDSYPIPRITDSPRMHIDLIASELPPSGAAEAAFAPAAAAIANAISQATGRRHRRLPIRLA